MKDHRGFLEFRITGLHSAESILIRMSLVSSPPGLLGDSGQVAIRVASGGIRSGKISVLPAHSGELLFKLSTSCEMQRRTLSFTSDDQFIKVYSHTGSAQNLAISIDNSVSSSGDMSGVSSRAQNDLSRQVRDMVHGGATINDLLDQHFPDRWETIELIDDDDEAPLDLNLALGLSTPADDGESLLRQALWEVLGDGQVTAQEKDQLNEIIRQNAIVQKRANALIQEVRSEVQLQRSKLQEDYAARNSAALLGNRDSHLRQVASNRIADWKRWAELGWAEACLLMGNCCDMGIGIEQNKPQSFEYYSQAARKGDAFAICSLGQAYMNGECVPKDESEGAKWFRKAADAECLEGMYHLARAYFWGHGLQTDRAEGLKWYRKAADMGYPLAMVDLGILYDEGRGVPEDDIEAAKWFRKAGEASGIDVFCNAGRHHEAGKDFVRAIKWYRRSADAGNAEAMFNLGYAYDNGEVVPKDAEEATRWYRKAADVGHTEAMYALACVYEEGSGVQEDAAAAAKWYRKAADAGHADAMNSLGYAYSNGQGVSKDDIEAAQWYRRSANAGLACAMFNLGCSYANGEGVPQDDAEAAKWFRKAADGGHAGAMCNLGCAYFNGNGVNKDQTQAAIWHHKSADLGNVQSKFYLGEAYYNGWGVLQDFTEAEKWLREANTPDAWFLLGEISQNVRSDPATARVWYEAAKKAGNEQAAAALLFDTLFTEKEQPIAEAPESDEIEEEEETAASEIKRIWVDDNVKRNDATGVLIHLHMEVQGLKGQQCFVGAYFSDAQGVILKTSNAAYRASNGQISVGQKLNVPYERTTWEDIQLFIPYRELFLDGSIHGQFQIHIFRADGGGNWETLEVSKMNDVYWRV